MAMRILDPVGELAPAPEGRPLRPVEALEGRFKPSESHRLYKKSTWNPAPPEEVEEFARKIDYAVVGVGA